MNKELSIPKKSSPFIVTFSRWKEDFALLVVLFLLSIFFVYYLPSRLSNLFFISLLLLFLFSEKDYFWFAYFFILVQGPGYFFSDFSGEALYRLPMYTFLPGMSLTPIDLFVVLALIKALLKGQRTKLRLKKPLFLILSYIIFSLIITIFVYGTDLESLAPVLRGPFYYSIIVSFSFLLSKRREAYYFIYLVLPSSFFILFTQLYFLITGNEFVNLFAPEFIRAAFTESGVLRPVMGGVLLILSGLIFSLFLLENKENVLSRKYLYLVIAITFFSVIISATRIWFVVFSFVLLGYILISKKKMKNLIKTSFVLIAITVILLMSGIISFDFLIKGPIGRLGQILTVAKGDFHSVPTFEYRYFFRLPRLLKGAIKYIIFGCGFSDDGLGYLDYHVGFFNTILQFGIIGFSLFLFFYFSYFNMISISVKKLRTINPLKISLKVIALCFGGILLANFSTWFFFPMSRTINTPFFIAVFLSLTELFVREAENEEKVLMGEVTFVDRKRMLERRKI